MTGLRRATLPVLLGTSYALGMAVTDWSQLVSGIGNLPKIAGSFVGIATTLVLLKVPLPESQEAVPLHRIGLPMGIAWGSAAAIIVAMALWLVDGVWF